MVFVLKKCLSLSLKVLVEILGKEGGIRAPTTFLKNASQVPRTLE
jgi:hypothetical protein